VEQFAVAIGVAIAFALIFALGEWFFERLTGRLTTRLRYRWRWLVLPMTALISFGLFTILRPLVLDQPMSPLVFLGLLGAVALLVSGATALGYAIVEAGKLVIGLFRSR
jgi:hypothetical protein